MQVWIRISCMLYFIFVLFHDEGVVSAFQHHRQKRSRMQSQFTLDLFLSCESKITYLIIVQTEKKIGQYSSVASNIDELNYPFPG